MNKIRLSLQATNDKLSRTRKISISSMQTINFSTQNRERASRSRDEMTPKSDLPTPQNKVYEKL